MSNTSISFNPTFSASLRSSNKMIQNDHRLLEIIQNLMTENNNSATPIKKSNNRLLQDTFTNAQIDKLKKLTNGNEKNFYKGYEYVSSLIKSGELKVDERTEVWFERAVNINRNDTNGAANVFIRAVTYAGLTLDGREVTPDGIQAISNKIGQAVIEGLVNQGGIPKFPFFIQNDIRESLRSGGQTLGGWGGSFYYWDVEINGKTIGERITSNPRELEKFLTSNAYATRQSIVNELLGPLSENQLREVSEFGWKSPLPVTLKAEITRRAASGNYAGDPDIVAGYIRQPNGKWYPPPDAQTKAEIELRSEIISNFLKIELD